MTRLDALGIDHIGIAVRDLEDAIAAYEQQYRLTVESRHVVAAQGVEEANLRLGDGYVQLLTPLAADTTVARFLDRRGEGLHHVAYRVERIEPALEHLAATGARLIDATPRPGPGPDGARIAFVHPGALAGTLIELVERTRPMPAGSSPTP
ncbi:MAG: methylmalonyl-CoA epimerase [Nitriliruptorales bacterium]|nr:methylmalonyl-CoA epimerase [Nitriliruptorales bacterium]